MDSEVSEESCWPEVSLVTHGSHDCAVRLLLIGPSHENHHNPRSWSIPKSRDSREEEGERSSDDNDLKDKP